MANNTQRAKAIVDFDGQSAAQAIEDLKTKTKALREEWNKFEAAGNKKGMQDLAKQINSVEKQMEGLQRETLNVAKVMKNLNGSSFNELARAEKLVTAELKGMTRGTEEYIAKSAQLHKVSSELTKVKTEMKGVSETTGKGGGILPSMFGVAGGIGIAELTAKMVDFGKQSLQAFMEAEKGARLLKFAVGGNTKVVAELEEQAQKFKDTGLWDDDDVIKSQSYLAVQGRTTEQIKKTIEAATKLSIVTGDDLQTSVQKIDASYEGVTKGLARLDSGFKDLTETELANGAAADLINKKYAGTVEEMAGSTEAQLGKAKNAWDDLKENIGEGISKVITSGSALENLTNKTAVDLMKSGELSTAQMEKLKAAGKDGVVTVNELSNAMKPATMEMNSFATATTKAADSLRVMQEKGRWGGIDSLTQNITNLTAKWYDERIHLGYVTDETEKNLRAKIQLKAQYDAELSSITNTTAAKKKEVDEYTALVKLLAELTTQYEKEALAADKNQFFTAKKLEAVQKQLQEIDEYWNGAKLDGMDEYMASLDKISDEELLKIALRKQADADASAERRKDMEEEQKLQEKNAEEKAKKDAEYKENQKKLEEDLKKMREDLAWQAVGAATQILDQQSSAKLQKEQRDYDVKDAAERARLQKKLDQDENFKAEYDKRIAALDKKKSDNDLKLRQKEAMREKEIASLKIAIDLAQAIFKINAIAAAYTASGALPLAALAWSQLPFVIGSAAVNAALVWAQPQPKFAAGGPTGPGMFGADNTGHRVAGVVHANEYVIPAWERRIPRVMAYERIIEGIRQRGYADGGPVGYQNLTASIDPAMLMVLENIHAAIQTQKVILPWSDLEDKQAKRVQITNDFNA